jgi:hypothetical protein
MLFILRTLFIAERVAGLTAIRSVELPLLCAIANVLDSARATASVIIETFMVFPFHRLRHSSPACGLKFPLRSHRGRATRGPACVESQCDEGVRRRRAQNALAASASPARGKAGDTAHFAHPCA